jgi:hypothetical protein
MAYQDEINEAEAEAQRLEAELRATLRPGGSTERVWHLIDFNIERDKRMAERHVDLEQMERTIHRGWRWVWLGPLQTAISVAALVMAMFVVYELRATPDEHPAASWVVNGESLSVAEKAKLDGLIKGLGNDDESVRSEAEKGILSFGPRALPELERVLNQQNADLHARLIKLIAQLSAPAEPAGLSSSGKRPES